MTSREARLARFCLSPAMAVLLAALALTLAVTAFASGKFFIVEGDRGPALPSPNLWVPASSQASFLLSLVCIGATAALMALINSKFNILRDYSLTFVGLFLVATCVTPTIVCSFEGGSLLAPVILASVALMFSVYNRPSHTRHIFLAFLLPGAGTLFQYGFAPFLLIFLLGCAQMRVFTLRGLIAAIVGIATPWWLWWAFGGCCLRLPEFIFLLDAMPKPQIYPFICSVGLSLLTVVMAGVFNAVRLFGYNAKARAFNGLLTVLAVVNVALLFVDYTNLIFYITLLNAMAAFQAGHFLVLYAHKRAYLAAILLPVAWGACFVWRMLI